MNESSKNLGLKNLDSDEYSVQFCDLKKWAFSQANNIHITASSTALYILTDLNELTIFDNFKSKSFKYKLIPSVTKDQKKYQINDTSSKIFCDKLGNHVIIKHEKHIYYYNQIYKNDLNLKELVFEYDSKYIEPFAIAFNDNDSNNNDTGEILITDYFSDIYQLRIKIIESNSVDVKFEKIFSFKTKFQIKEETYYNNILNDIENKENNNEDIEDEIDLYNNSFFNFEPSEKILDIKMTKNASNGNIVIIACTKNMIFNFNGKGTFKEIFSKYSVDNGDIYKAFKKIPNNSNEKNFNNSYIQIIDSYSPTLNYDKKKNRVTNKYFGCMGGYGYCIGSVENINEELSIYDFNRPSNLDNNNKIALFVDDFKKQKKKQHDPIIACQSKLHIFTLYDDSIIMTNKITGKIVHYKTINYNFMNMFYNEKSNSIMLYSSNEIYDLAIKNEDLQIWQNYLQINKFDLAINSLPIEDALLRGKLHKIKGDFLFNEKKYELAGKEYAYSTEHFEHVCYKFLKINEINGIITYLNTIKNHKLNEYKEKLFLAKYLLYTLLAELLIEKEDNKNANDNNNNNTNNNNKNNNDNDDYEKITFEDFQEEYRHHHKDKYIDKNIFYYFLEVFNREKDYMEFASFKTDFNIIIQNYINKGKFDMAFDYLEKFIISDGYYDLDSEKLIKVFLDYTDIFMKKSIIHTVKLFDNMNCNERLQNELIRSIMSCNYLKFINEDENNCEIILDYLRKNIISNISNKIKNKNINDLYLLFLSLSKKPTHIEEILEFLKGPINTYQQINKFLNVSISPEEISINLNFAQKILQNVPSALALIYFLMRKYDLAVNTAMENGEKDLAVFIVQNIKDEKIKKKIWLKIFQYFKKNNLESSKKILETSNGVLNLEDILPFIMDEIKLKDLKTDLQDCIDVYEEVVNNLKSKINIYNLSNKNIQNSIYKIMKTSLNLEHRKIKCVECGNSANFGDNKFFLFPCGHVFDANCLVNILIDYDNKNIGDARLKQKVSAIKSLTEKIWTMQLKKKKNKKNLLLGSLQKIKTSSVKVFFTLINKEQKNKEKEKIDEEFSKEEEIQLKELSIGLYSLLREECVLCGKEMIYSTQIKFGDEDEKKWENLVIQ